MMPAISRIAAKHLAQWGPPVRQAFRRLRPALVVVLLGIALVVIAYHLMRKADDTRIRAVVEVRFERQARDFERKLVIAEGSLETFAVFATIQNQIGAQTFHRLARLIHGPETSEAALVWAPLVRSSERAAFVTAARETVDDFDIVETAPAGNFVIAPEREEYLPVLFTEVYRDRPDIAGLDILSLPERRIWIERARDAARPIATPPISIFDGSGTRVAFLVVWPVYSTAEIPAATEQRRKAFRGVAINQLRFDDLFPAAIAKKSAIPEVIELLVDGVGDSSKAQPAAIYDLSLHRVTIAATSSGVLPAGLTFTREFERLGRRWILIAHLPAEAETSLRSALPLMWLVLGLGLTAMLAAYTYHERGKRSAAERVAVQRTAELSSVNQSLALEWKSVRGAKLGSSKISRS
jgi:CHASE1-domain containing sensor protein